MKYLLTTLLLSVTTLPIFSANVTITFNNLRTPAGILIVGIYNKPEGFPKEGSQWKKVFIPINKKQVTKTFDLPEGEYAFAVCHDEDGDGTCNQNFLGIPTEGFAFSNNYRPKLRAPSFDDVKIKVGKQDLNLSIKLIYF